MKLIGAQPPSKPGPGATSPARARRARLLGVGLRVRGGTGTGQELEVAALVGLGDLLAEQGAVAAPEPGRRWLPGGTALGQLTVVHLHPQYPLGHVQGDRVAAADQR